MIVALTGGTGGAKLVEGLAGALDPAELILICNTGDDAIFHGLYVSPDVDTIIYTLAGLSGEKGWGIGGDTFAALQQLRRLGEEAWFHLGDKDLATHIFRTRLLGEGRRLSQITDQIRRALGIESTILPMSDDRVETRVATPQGEISFQEFFVKERWAPVVLAVHYVGAEQSRPAAGVLEAIRDAEAIVVCPSNPVTSIGPILAVPGIRAALTATAAPVIGISPIIGAAAISGPAHKLMLARGRGASALGVAQDYSDFLDAFLIAEEDRVLAKQIGDLQIDAVCTNVRMLTPADKQRLAREVLAWVKK
ncbi:MAG TPA: 2-phospho-L-lactate transferase [Candidatus Binatia bacterium]